jgi:hypothetical protein
MYVNTKTNKPAWLIEQDQAGQVTYTTSADPDARHQHAPASEFFANHQAADQADQADAAPAAQRLPMQNPPAKAKKPAPKKATPNTARKEGQAEPPAKPSAAAHAPEPPPASGGGEPHGEKGSQTK